MRAADVQRIKNLLPTSLGSDEIRSSIAREILQRSIFSARMESVRYLERLRSICEGISAGTIDQATARATLLSELGQMGHSMQDGGGLTNPASIKRLNLIIDTQRQMAASVANLANETDATLNAYPAWELTRMVGRSLPRRDWNRRWNSAGASVGWEGALPSAGSWPDWSMIALKSSPIWEALGDGAGGWRDTLGNPYPPFAYGSGLSWDDVERARCVRLGLINDSDDLSGVDRPSLSVAEQDIVDAARRTGFDVGKGLA